MMQGPPRVGRYMSEEEKKNAPKVTKVLLKRTFAYIRPYWKQEACVLLIILVSSVMAIVPSILTGKIVDDGLIGQDLNMLVKLILISLAVTLGSNLIGVVQTYLESWIAQHITYDMRNQMYSHLQKMSTRFFTANNQGDIITRMTSDIDGVRNVLSTTFTSILSNAVTLTVALITMFQKNWIMAILGMVIVPLFTLPTRAAGKTRWQLTRDAQECNDNINGILNETLSVSRQTLVKLFNQEANEYARYEENNRKMINLNIKESMAGRWFRVAIDTVSSVGPMLLYLAGGVLMLKYNSSLTVGDITVLVALLSRMYMPVNRLLGFQVDWIRSMALFTRLFDYFDMSVEIESPENPVAMDSFSGNVTFDHVSFHYNAEREILKDISFNLEAGHSIAIVGPSGSGKSTIVNLIPRLYDVTGGSVKFDGVDVRDLDLEDVRREVGIVTQETYLFNGTIRQNLLYAKADASEEEMIDACRKANIWDFISKQEKGLDTEVGNRGLKLSGGEKQRISIARILLKNPAVMIFDEATSALDSISEAAIQKAIDPLVENCTSILIAHRLSTILAADEILVIKDGMIAERGTHQELVGKGGVYTELYNTQFKTEANLEKD